MNTKAFLKKEQLIQFIEKHIPSKWDYMFCLDINRWVVKYNE